MLNAGMDVHLSAGEEQAAGNHRNGTSPKTVDTGTERAARAAKVQLPEVPRGGEDRAGA